MNTRSRHESLLPLVVLLSACRASVADPVLPSAVMLGEWSYSSAHIDGGNGVTLVIPRANERSRMVMGALAADVLTVLECSVGSRCVRSLAIDAAEYARAVVATGESRRTVE